MSQDGGTGLSLVEAFLHLFHSPVFHMLQKLFFGNGEQFERFYDVVAQEVEKCPLYLSQFLLSFFGKGTGQVLPHRLLAVADEVVDHQVDRVGESVEHSEGQQ